MTAAALQVCAVSGGDVSPEQPLREQNSGPESGTECAEGAGLPPPAPSFTRLVLTAPPSANSLFISKRGGARARSKVYDQWIATAAWQLRLQKPERIRGPVVVIIGVERSDLRADIDNRIKPTLDLISGSRGCIDDDRHVVAVAAAWLPQRAGHVHVLIIPADQPITLDFQLADAKHGGFFLREDAR